MTNLLSREDLELVRSRLVVGGVFYYNTTLSANAQKTAIEAYPYAWRVNGFMAVSDAPIAFDKQRWRAFLRPLASMEGRCSRRPPRATRTPSSDC